MYTCQLKFNDLGVCPSLLGGKESSTILTFEQPLYRKASEITTCINAPGSSHLKGIVLLVGCFHTPMSSLGATGIRKEGTSLENVVGPAYGGNSVSI